MPKLIKGGIVLPQSLPGLLLAFCLGLGVALVNYRLTAKAARNPNERFGAVSLIRQALNLGSLAAVYFLAPYTPWDRIWCLVGVVAGLTVPTIFLTFRLLRRLGADKQGQDKGGEN